MKTTKNRRSYPSIKKKGEMVLAIKEGLITETMRKFPSDKKVYALVENGTANVQSIRNNTIYLIFNSHYDALEYLAVNDKIDVWEIMELQLWTTV